jgi:hypothetical protein
MDKKAKEKEDQKINEVSEVGGDDFKEYFKESFTNSNLIMTKHLKKWTSVDVFSLKDIIANILKSFNQKKRLVKRSVKNYLPGFSGVLNDNKMVSELRSLFGENYFFFTTGQIKINRKVANVINTLIRSLYYRVNNHHRGFFTFLMSIMKEAVITEGESDNKITDVLFGYLNDIQELCEAEDSLDRDGSCPDPMEDTHLSSQYVEQFAVSWANEDNNLPQVEFGNNISFYNSDEEEEKS